jgi:DNA-binding response OmpR family regulator
MNIMTSSSETPATRVLVIDDEPAICRIVAHTLKRNGFEVDSVSDANEVEHTLQASQFDVILLDRSMGGMRGSSLVPLLRSQAPGAKILYFTGEFVESDEVAAVDGVVQKPVNSKQLTETLRSVL